MLDEITYNLECCSFDEKIFLGKLEAAKAKERVAELIYEKARYQMQALQVFAKQAQDRQIQAVANAPKP
jgi:hypothetical protein